MRLRIRFMLKISQIGNASRPVTLRLEGRMVGPWVGEVRATCQPYLDDGRSLQLDLTGVVFVDQAGVEFLKELISRGIELVGGSLFVEEQLRRG